MIDDGADTSVVSFKTRVFNSVKKYDGHALTAMEVLGKAVLSALDSLAGHNNSISLGLK